MNKILIVISFIVTVKANSQPISAATAKILSEPGKSFLYQRVHYPDIDTLKCHFLESVNDSTFIWKTGFVVRNKGFFDFDKTSVTQEYLPITSGIVSSKVFYSNMSPIKRYAIQIILKTKTHE